MVQFLISLIEWFALVALSSIGVDASDIGRCASDASARPAEYHEAALHAADEPVKAGWAALSADPCLQWLPINDSRGLPELLSPPLVYNS